MSNPTRTLAVPAVAEAHKTIAVCRPPRFLIDRCDHPQVTETILQQCAFAIEFHSYSLHQ